MYVKVWDIPTRLFHWCLVAAFTAAYFTSGSEWYLEYHTIAGYCALALIAFRLFWGFAGNRHARFSSFLKGWREVKIYILNTIDFNPPRYIGHNPAGGWMIMVIIVVTTVLTLTGVITYSGEENRGPLAGLFSYDAGLYARAIHAVLADFIIILIVFHISAALFHDFFLRENIILSMFTGTKEDKSTWRERLSHTKPGEGRSVIRLVIFIVITLLAGAALKFLPPEGGGGRSPMEEPTIVDAKGNKSQVIPNENWKAECASACHGAFHPTLLPASSWKRVIANLEEHFGDDASLDDETTEEILRFLLSASAEYSRTEASQKILRSIRKGDIPVRITDTPYWIRKHREITDDVYSRGTVVSKSNCVACHPGADVGSFEDEDIHIPAPKRKGEEKQ